MDLHGKPDVVIDNKELIKNIQKWSYGLYSILMFNFPNDISIKRVEYPEGNFLLAAVNGADYTYYLVDGIIVKRHLFYLLPNFPAEEIRSVEILKNPKNKAKYYLDLERSPFSYPGGNDAFIAIYTYAGNGMFGFQKTKGLSKKMVQVYNKPQEFYAPIYDYITDLDWEVPDLRSIIHWQPNRQTDTFGKAQVEFYNADAVGDMLVIIECITDEGKIGYYEMAYPLKIH
jgi:hypothetical protein